MYNRLGYLSFFRTFEKEQQNTMKRFICTWAIAAHTLFLFSQELFVEAESFKHKGGWVVDQQFMDMMGSPYLMAHGMGEAVDDAYTDVEFPEPGTYHAYVRTYNWTSPWSDHDGPGKFALYVGNKKLLSPLGCTGTTWNWQYAGKVSVKQPKTTLRLKDLTGFNGRCDAIYFTKDKSKLPPSDQDALADFRRDQLHIPSEPLCAGEFDLVVVGAGVAGMCAAVSASRLGCKVALINDRPVVGGNNSSEIRVHLGGRIESGPYKELGNLIKEFGPEKGGNAQPAHYYEDQKKMDWLLQEKNISLFTNYHVNAVKMNGNRIEEVIAQHIETGERLSFKAPLFSDCTGDGSVGYLAGADYKMGRESREEFGESTAPETADKMVMGASVQWYSVDTDKKSDFPVFDYGLNFNDMSCEKVTMGEWTWETGMNQDMTTDFEQIRDYGLLVVYANWSYLKNRLTQNDTYAKKKLGWVAYLAGKRESRRLLGDYILKEDDIRKYVMHEDATAATTWSIDLHYPDPANSKYFKDREFKSIANQMNIYPYPIPYRCLYSRNIENLFMAGRNISVTHVALGTVRVMRTTGMMGEVVGMAASICKKHEAMPRQVYWYHLDELKSLMKEGTGVKGLPNNQQYNEGGTLTEKPELK